MSSLKYDEGELYLMRLLRLFIGKVQHINMIWSILNKKYYWFRYDKTADVPPCKNNKVWPAVF